MNRKPKEGKTSMKQKRKPKATPSANQPSTKQKESKTKTKNTNSISNLFTKEKDPNNIDFTDKKVLETIKTSDLVNPFKVKEYVEGANMPKWSLNYILHVYKTEVMKHSTILVRMVMRNGTVCSFITNSSRPIFIRMGGAYIIDPSKIKDDTSSGHATLFYHQDLSLPYDPNIDATKIRDAIYGSDDKAVLEIIQNTNPKTLLATVKSTLIQQVMAGGVLDKQIKAVIIIMVVNLVLTLILMIGTAINSFI